MTEAEHLTNSCETAYSEDGVDLTLIRTLRKIQSLLSLETVFLKKQIRNTQDKIGNF